MTEADRVFAWRCRRAVRLLGVRRLRLIEADLAELSGSRERTDLIAMLDRYDDDQSAEVREILVRQQVRLERGPRLAGGLGVPRAGW
ncbi:MAG: hypothetical protein ABI083_15820 [Lapillicoccus sp.]